VPAAVVWEVSLLARAGRVNLRRSLRTFFDELRFTRDPFDGLIVAAARALDVPSSAGTPTFVSSGLCA
jgi:PIN domain nuclease of toxin-antitoxin system